MLIMLLILMLIMMLMLMMLLLLMLIGILTKITESSLRFHHPTNVKDSVSAVVEYSHQTTVDQ